METMSPAERKWSMVFGFGLATLCTLPYLLGFFNESTDWFFSGFIFGVEDGNSYIAKMLAGSNGDWLFRTPYTLLEQRGELIFLPYLLLGKLAQPPEQHTQLVALFHLFRFLATPLCVYAIYRFSTLFLTQVVWRRWATIMATLGGGLGWIVPLFGRAAVLGDLPLDFISPETFGFLAFLGLPHLVLARGLMILAIHAYLENGKGNAKSWESGILILLLTLVQSLTTLSVYAVVLIHQVTVVLASLRTNQKRLLETWLPAAVRTILPSLPLILYYMYQFTTDTFLQTWTAQNRILSPHPLHYLIAYGVVLIPVLAAIGKKPWQENPIWLLPVGWVIALPLLAYFPHNLQRRLVDGVWVALIVLAAFFLAQWNMERRRPRYVWLMITLLSLISPIMIFVGSLQVVQRPAAPVFVPGDQVRAFRWLETHAQRGSVVLAAYATSNTLPAWAPVRVPIGHGPESVDLDKLEPEVRAVFHNTLSSIGRLRWLKETGVDYLIFTEAERALGAWSPDQEGYLAEVYGNASVTIYEVQDATD
jgi:hypothetical protein